VNDQPEDPSRAESAGTRLSSFSSSLGPQRSANATASADPEPNGDSSSAKGQLSDRVSDASSKLASLSAERPEVVIAAAFVGGLVVAAILKRLAR
jgi:hypothetical protein